MESGTSCPEIVAKDLSFTYHGSSTPALTGVNLGFRGGEFCAVLGRNGSGKSTLAHCLNALLKPTSGRVVSCGIDTAACERSPEIRKRVAMVFQNPGSQIIGTTVEEEVAFGPENLGLPAQLIRKRVDRAMELAGISELKKNQPLRLSQGQKQLVAIAGALAMEPDFLVSDESTSMLDYRARMRVIRLFLRLKETGTGIVHITHMLEEATAADRVVVLDGGRVAADGTPAETLCEPARMREMGLNPLPVSLVVQELAALGHDPGARPITVKELISWLSL